MSSANRDMPSVAVVLVLSCWVRGVGREWGGGGGFVGGRLVVWEGEGEGGWSAGRGPRKGRMARERPMYAKGGVEVEEEEEGSAEGVQGSGPPTLTKMMAHVFSKARAVRADVTKRLSARGFRARPAGLQSDRPPGFCCEWVGWLV